MNNTNSNQPIIKKVPLQKEYLFMYECYLITTQNTLYLLLEERESIIYTLTFDFKAYKFGYPNDEVLGLHLLANYGLGYYDVFEVGNSPWLAEIMVTNRAHPHHNDSMFAGYRHIVITFKDSTLEVICRTMKEVELSKQNITDLIAEQTHRLKKDDLEL